MVELPKDILLDGRVFRGGLDNDVGTTQVFEDGCATQTAENGVSLIRRQLAPVRQAHESLLDVSQRAVNDLLVDVVEDHRHTRLRSNLTDSTPHLSRADNPNRPNVCCHTPSVQFCCDASLLGASARVEGAVFPRL